jgi:signal transduction histidine kinase
LTLTRSSQAEPNRVDVDLRELASQVSDELMTLAIEKDVLIEVKGVSGKMRGDPTALKQVIANLIGNAIKFTDEGGVTISVSSSTGSVQLSVEDTGMGFPTSDRDELRTLLEPFRRGHAAVRPGAGLGLAVVREVVDAHGGSVELSNREGGGARITITLPQTGTAPVEVKA